jgi:hypothetical protein
VREIGGVRFTCGKTSAFLADGSPGSNGVDGADGTQGPAGAQGLTGPQGPVGPQGVPGAGQAGAGVYPRLVNGDGTVVGDRVIGAGATLNTILVWHAGANAVITYEGPNAKSSGGMVFYKEADCSGDPYFTKNNDIGKYPGPEPIDWVFNNFGEFYKVTGETAQFREFAGARASRGSVMGDGCRIINPWPFDWQPFKPDHTFKRAVRIQIDAPAVLTDGYSIKYY